MKGRWTSLAGPHHDVYTFLGVKFAIDNTTKRVKLTQTGLINKVPNITGMEELNNMFAPSTTMSIGAYSEVQPMKEQ